MSGCKASDHVLILTVFGLPEKTMDHAIDPSPSLRVVRLFPLPDVVLLPHTMLPLHIFEPRYRQMTEDALARDKGIAIVRLKPGPPSAAAMPAIEEVACLGEIVEHRRLPDGRFNILLAGRRRVRLRREVPSEKLYRIAEAEVLEDEYPDADIESLRSELLALCRATLESSLPDSQDLGWLWSSELPLGVLTDITAAAARSAPDVRQALLNELRVDHRVEILLSEFRRMPSGSPSDGGGSGSFPPAFSAN